MHQEKEKRLQYDRSRLRDAVNAVTNQNMSVREASRQYEVPRSTLQDRLHRRVDADCKVGRDTVLNQNEEEAIVQWLIRMAICGFPRTRYNVINTVKNIIKEDKRPNPFKNGKPGDKWYSLFLKRHPILNERAPEAITLARAVVTEEYIRKWFNDLHEYLKSIGHEDILQDPRRIYNGDETSFSICPKTGKVIGPKGWKNLYEIAKGSEKETITVLLVISAAGESLPPMVVFPYVRRPPKEVVDSAPPSWFIGLSDSGWMRSGIFFEYVANGLNDWVSSNNVPKPILFLVDGHKSHLTQYLSKFCDENGIILYALPPNTTHIMQPADVSVFRPLKLQWRETIKNWLDDEDNSHKKLSKVTFCPLLQQTLKQITSDTIKNGFRKCGLYPFNPDAVDYTKCIKNIQESIMQENKECANEENKVTENDLQTTFRVLKNYEKELKESGIELTHIEKIIMEKRENLHRSSFNLGREINKSYDKMENVELTVKRAKIAKIENEKKKKENNSVTEFCDTLRNIHDQGVLEYTDSCMTPVARLEDSNNSHTSVSLLETADVKTLLNEDQSLIILPLYDDIPIDLGTNRNDERSSTPDIPPQEITITAEIHGKNANVHTLNTEITQTRNCDIYNSCEAKTDRKDLDAELPILSISAMNNIDIASDFDFSLPGSPSLEIKTSPACSRPNSKTSTPTSRYAVSPALRKHLYAPKALDFRTKNKPKRETMPLAISSGTWRQYMKEKDDEKENIVKQREERKRRIEHNKAEREKKKIEKRTKKINQLSKPKVVKKKLKDKNQNLVVTKNEKEKILCAGCEEELVSDVEEDENKNIGCDICPKWFHLKCTVHRGRNYIDVAKEDYTCHHCLVYII